MRSIDLGRMMGKERRWSAWDMKEAEMRKKMGNKTQKSTRLRNTYVMAWESRSSVF